MNLLIKVLVFEVKMNLRKCLPAAGRPIFLVN